MLKKALVSAVLVLTVSAVYAQSQYRPTGFVNDFANIIPNRQERELETEIREYENGTSIEIAVVTVPSLNGLEIEEFATKLFNSWGVGKKGKDNGVMLLVAPNERRLRIEVGYGLEPDLTDAEASRIIENSIVPLFKEDDMPGGIVTGVREIIEILGGMPITQRPAERERIAVAERQAREAEQLRREIQAREDRMRKIESDRARAEFLSVAIPSAVGFALSVLGGWYLHRRRRLKKLQIQNLQDLQTAEQEIYAYAASLPERRAVIRRLKEVGPASVWGVYEEKTKDGLFVKEHEELSQNALYSNYSEAEAYGKKVASFRQKIADDAAVLSGIEAKIEEVRASYAEWSAKLPSVTGDLANASDEAKHPDVTENTKANLTQTQEKFNYINTPGKDLVNTVDWIAVLFLLREVTDATATIRKAIEGDKKFAIEARNNHGEALTRLLTTLASLKDVVDHSDVKTGTKDKYDDLVDHCDTLEAIQDVVERYRAILEAEKTAEEIKNLARKNKRDAEDARERARLQRERDRQSSSSITIGGSRSSYGGGRSSGGFGGGGRSGGGGASGRW